MRGYENHTSKVKIAITIIVTPLLILPEIIIMLSPFLVFFLPVMMHIAAVFTGTVVLWWIVITLLSVFTGRAYCSHICSITGLFSFISFITIDRKILSMEYPKIMGKIVLFFWVVAPTYVLLRNIGNFTGILPKEEIYSETVIILYYCLFAISGILANIYGKIPTRHYACPFSSFMITANRLGRKLKLPSLKFSIERELCRSCGKCSKKCMVNRNIPHLMNAGMINFEVCVQCGHCTEVCRYSAIRYSWHMN